MRPLDGSLTSFSSPLGWQPELIFLAHLQGLKSRPHPPGRISNPGGGGGVHVVGRTQLNDRILNCSEVGNT